MLYLVVQFLQLKKYVDKYLISYPNHQRRLWCDLPTAWDDHDWFISRVLELEFSFLSTMIHKRQLLSNDTAICDNTSKIHWSLDRQLGQFRYPVMIKILMIYCANIIAPGRLCTSYPTKTYESTKFD